MNNQYSYKFGQNVSEEHSTCRWCGKWHRWEKTFYSKSKRWERRPNAIMPVSLPRGEMSDSWVSYCSLSCFSHLSCPWKYSLLCSRTLDNQPEVNDCCFSVSCVSLPAVFDLQGGRKMLPPGNQSTMITCCDYMYTHAPTYIYIYTPTVSVTEWDSGSWSVSWLDRRPSQQAWWVFS